MKIDSKNYSEFNTPHKYSYCPDADEWYKDDEGIMPEPESKPTAIENFVIDDILGVSFNSKEENEKEFQDFIAYNFGVENDEGSFCFSILNISQFPEDMDDDTKAAVEMYWFDDILELAFEIEQGKNSCKYIESYGCNKFFAWQKDNNKVRFAVQKYAECDSYREDFIFLYDVLVDKTQLVSELRRVVNKYKDMAIKAIEGYKEEYVARFTNIRQNRCLEKWMNIKNGSYDDWEARKFITAAELEKFINELRPKLMGKPLKNVIITGNMFNQYDELTLERIDGKYYECEWIEYNEDFSEGTLKAYLTDYDPDNLEEYCCRLDEPVVVKIGDDIQLEINFHEHSLVQIGLNSMKEGDYKSYYSYPWRDISSRFKKNLLGHTIKDIYINKTKQSSVSWQVKRDDGDDMYNEIGIIFDNNYKLAFGIDFVPDYMRVSEIAPTK